MARELGDTALDAYEKRTGLMDTDIDKAVALAQGVDVIGDPMKIIAMSDEKQEQLDSGIGKG